jgi:hypothetical protein
VGALLRNLPVAASSQDRTASRVESVPRTRVQGQAKSDPSRQKASKEGVCTRATASAGAAAAAEVRKDGPWVEDEEQKRAGFLETLTFLALGCFVLDDNASSFDHPPAFYQSKIGVGCKVHRGPLDDTDRTILSR